MYLVDTSVWIGYLSENENEAVARFVDVLDLGVPSGITGDTYNRDFDNMARVVAELKLA